MTDTAPRATICPNADCRALVPSNERDAHVKGHNKARKADLALRAELNEIHRLLNTRRTEHDDLARQVAAIEIPEATLPLVIEDYPEDELDNLDPEPTDLDEYDTYETAEPDTTSPTTHFDSGLYTAATIDPLSGLPR